MKTPMRRKALAQHYQIGLRTVDKVLNLMRKSGDFEIVEGTIVLADKDEFGWALAHREELREQL